MFDLSSTISQGRLRPVPTSLIGLFLFFPLYWLVISSVKSNAELYRIIPTPFPLAPTLTHFVTALTTRQSADVPGQQPDRIGRERRAQHAARALCRLQLRQVPLHAAASR